MAVTVDVPYDEYTRLLGESEKLRAIMATCARSTENCLDDYQRREAHKHSEPSEGKKEA